MNPVRRWGMRGVMSAGLMLSVALYAIPPAAPAAAAARAVLKTGDRLAILGDSITEQKLYSNIMETYLTACVPELKLHVMQFGWSGDTASGFAGRMRNDLLPWKPTVVTTCYGMNDGGYRAFEPGIGAGYARAMSNIVATLSDAGATVVVGSPGVVDTQSYGKGHAAAAITYNETLGRLSELARALAESRGLPFADVHNAMLDAMVKAKAQYGDTYLVSKDGVHPSLNGHLVMAYAFLHALGLDGDLGAITVDWKGAATGSNGHKVVTSAEGHLEVESARYAFCFPGGTNDANGAASILPFVPFQNELNRFTLAVRNLPSAKAQVTWGGHTQTFTREQLTQGINLAAEYLDNPFCAPMQQVAAAVAAKQNYETFAIKNTVTSFGRIQTEFNHDPEVVKATDLLTRKVMDRQAELGAKVRATVQPVRHTIMIVPTP